VRLHQFESGAGPAKRQNCETNPFGLVWRTDWSFCISSAGLTGRALARQKGKTAKRTHLASFDAQIGVFVFRRQAGRAKTQEPGAGFARKHACRQLARLAGWFAGLPTSQAG
jgi:hypothetical protein